MLCITPAGSQLLIGSQYVLYEKEKKKTKTKRISGKSLQESFLGTILVCSVVTDLDESKQEYTLAFTYPVSLSLSNLLLATRVY